MSLSREEAITECRKLFRQYGLKWTAKVPREAYTLLNKVNEVLTEKDRREIAQGKL